MQYRIKVIEYESGRKEYVPQVRRNKNIIEKIFDSVKDDWIDILNRFDSEENAINIIKDLSIKSVTYKSVQP